MSKKKYENFSLGLALFDALPVIFFSVSMIITAINFKNTVFILGAVMCTLAGLLKVIWKIIIAASKKDISILNRQMRVVMPIGFLLIIIGAVLGRKAVDFSFFWGNALKMPCLLFFIITILGMVLMSVFAFKLDGSKAKSNWIEQITNATAQASLMIGIILAFN